MKKVAILYLLVLVGSTMMYAQRMRPVTSVPSFDSIAVDVQNALQDQRIEQMEKAQSDFERRMSVYEKSQAELVGTINRQTGIGIGIGATLTVLQFLQVLFQIKKEKVR